MSSTNTIGSAAGDISVTIGSNPDTFQLIEVSDITYKYDINDITQDTIDGVPFIIASCSITCLNEDDSGSTTLEDSELGTVVDVDLTIGGNTFPLEYRPQGAYSVDDIKGTVTFECVATDRTNTNTATASTVHDNGDGSDRDAYPIQQVIESALNDFGVSTFQINTSHFDDSSMPGSGEPPVWAATIDDTRVLRDCASLEAAYYGIWGATGFYVRRGSTANKVTITQDDIIDEDRDISFPDLKDLDITVNNDNATFVGGSIFHQDTETIDAAKRQSLTFTRSTDLIRVVFDGTDSRLENDTSSNSDTEASNVLDTGTEAYKDVLKSSAPFAIQLTVQGFDTIKPWQPFDITDTTGKLSNLTGKTYRGTEFVYSVEDTITINAYAIS